MIKQKTIISGMILGVLCLTAQIAVSNQGTITSVFSETDPIDHRWEMGIKGGTWLSSPDWSSDGKKIVFCFIERMTGNTDIWVMNIDGSYVKRLNITPVIVNIGGRNIRGDTPANPVWSPDGEMVAFELTIMDKSEEITTNIWRINADGTNLRQLTTAEDDNLPFWSPDGTKIVFYRWGDLNRDNLWIMNSDGTNQRHLVTGGEVYQPEWTDSNSKCNLKQ